MQDLKLTSQSLEANFFHFINSLVRVLKNLPISFEVVALATLCNMTSSKQWWMIMMGFRSFFLVAPEDPFWVGDKKSWFFFYFFISKRNIIKKRKAQSSTQEVYKKGI